MLTPFDWLTVPQRWIGFAVLSAATLAAAAALSKQGAGLRTPQAPRGILSYEFAWSAARASSILASWSGRTREAARQIRLDFGFLLLYPLAFSLGCAALAGSPRSSWAYVGAFLAWAVLAAAPLDALENYALLRMLSRSPTNSLARLAALCAGLKFMLVLASLGYIVLQGVAVAIASFQASSPPAS
jgi:hypothetical protein